MPEPRSLEERMVSCALQKHLGGVLGALCQDCAHAYAEQEVAKFAQEWASETVRALQKERDALLAVAKRLLTALETIQEIEPTSTLKYLESDARYIYPRKLKLLRAVADSALAHPAVRRLVKETEGSGH